jgi:hypothetical protein
MSRRVLLWAGLLLVVVLAGALALPDVRWWLWGHLRGESFYRSRPTSYWRGQVLAWNDLGFYPPAVSLVVRRPRWWADCLPWRSGRPAPLVEGEPFPGNDPAAIPVLMELLRDEDPEVRVDAAEALKQIDPQAAAGAGVGDTP